jgi:transposase
MDLHANAALSLNKRRLLAWRVTEEVRTLAKAAAAADVRVRCARKWVGRYRAEGELGLLDRSSAPARVANRTREDRVQAIACLRRLRVTGPEIAELLSMPLSTVSGILTRIGLGKLGRLGLEPARRYERARPGEGRMTDMRSDTGVASSAPPQGPRGGTLEEFESLPRALAAPADGRPATLSAAAPVRSRCWRRD